MTRAPIQTSPVTVPRNGAIPVVGGGQSWAQANNIELQPGMIPTFNINTELDFTNNSNSDCVTGQSNCIGLYIRIVGRNQSTLAPDVEGNPTSDGRPGAIFGARFSGPLASNSTISISTTGGASGIGIGTFGPASFSVATIDDASTSPAGLNITGKKSIAAVRLAAAAFNGIDLTSGSYAGSQIAGIGFSVSPTGIVTGQGFMSGGNTGQTCSGPPSSLFAVTNGIVTCC